MKTFLVVCEGNVCRSPMAQGLFTAALPQVRVQSAGLGALVGSPADRTAVRLMGARGIDISAHRAIQLNRQMCLVSDMVFVMNADQRQRIETAYPHARGRVFRIGENASRDIPDPYKQSEIVFRNTLSLLDESVRDWLQRIQRL